MSNDLPIGKALRVLRIRAGLTQTAVSKLPKSVVFRSLSHWETGRTTPSLTNVVRFLAALDLDFHDLQDALDDVSKRPSTMRTQIVEIERRLTVLERRQLEQIAQHLTERKTDA